MKLSHVIPLDTHYIILTVSIALFVVLTCNNETETLTKVCLQAQKGHEWRPSALIFTRIASSDLNGTIFCTDLCGCPVMSVLQLLFFFKTWN